MKFIDDSGGYEGGWTMQDHNLFLKIRSKYKNPEQLSKCLHGLCPGNKYYFGWYSSYLHI